MAIVETPIVEELNQIFIKEEEKPVNHHWEVKFILPDGDYKPHKLLSIDINRDYVNNYADEVFLTVSMPDGTFNNRFMRYKDNITVELIRYPVSEREEKSKEDEIVFKNYKVITRDNTNDIISALRHNSQQSEVDDLNNLNEREFQLLDLAVEKVRVFETGGIYRDEIPGKVVRYALTMALQRLKVPNDYKVYGVDMVTPDNQEPYKHVIIPQGTKLQNVASYIQEEWGGVYNTSIGSYLQGNLWYVWPQYNTNRYNKEERTLRVYNVPENTYPGVERTYRINGKELIVLSTGQVQYIDISYNEKLNFGNGTRFTSGDRIMSGFDTRGNTNMNKYFAYRVENNTEIKSTKWNDDDYAPVSPKRITNNLLAESSRLSRRDGSYIRLVWESSKEELIYPGMPAKLIYLEDDVINELDGVVTETHHYIHDVSKGPTQYEHRTNTAITLFIKRLKEWEG